MQNKGFVIALTVILSLLCIYFLSFTVVSRRVESDAVTFATNAEGIVDLSKKQGYLDSLRDKPVYNLLGAEYTYKQVKDNELNLGLDLQGGMHVTLEVSPADIIRGLAGNPSDSAFQKAMRTARQAARTTNRPFSQLFFDAYQKQNPDRSLASIFTHATTRGKITNSSNNQEVTKIVNEEIDKAIDRSYTILQNRLDKFGTSSANIQQLPGTGRIQVEIPGIDNPERVRKLLQGVAHLEFWDVTEPQILNTQLMAINQLLVKEQLAQPKVKGETAPKKDADLKSLLSDSTAANTQADTTKTTGGLDSLQNNTVSPLFSLSNPPGAFRYSLSDTARINKIFKREDVRGIMRNVRVFWAYKSDVDQVNNSALQLYFIDMGRSGTAKLSGDVINEARLSNDEYARPAVSMTMNVTGSRIWAKMTRDASSKSPGGRIAIVLDNSVYSAPHVNGEIPNGNSQISGSFTIEEAKDLANILQAGSLPAPCTIVEEAIIGPTLGQTAQQAGIVSSVAGLILIVLFMVVYYSRGGWVANFALLFNMFFILGILAQPSFGTALTLPGIAGIVLTMGMAVDANVLIYERVKEEIGKGRSNKEAVQIGFKRAFASIFDSNLTTLITGIFLLIFGQGPIKGFAVTLIIGIVTSFFTAIYISRIVIEWMMSRAKGPVSFESAISRAVKRRKYFDFLKTAPMVSKISWSVVAIGFLLIFVKPLNMGVDFKGGRSFVVTFDKPIVATDMKVSLSESFEGSSTEVKNYGGNNVMKVTTAYHIEDNSEEADKMVRDALIAGVEKFSGAKFVDREGGQDANHFTISGTSKVGATVADDIKKSAWKASLFSLIGIFIYILLRFNKWQYSWGAILATIHDSMFVFAAFSIANVLGISFEIDQIFVASILTVIGYSINDTVIIFDRIRENMSLGYTTDKKRIVNDALNDTLSRTIITSGTTIIAVLVLLLFGGEVLRGFSFALFIGVVVGTYSSIFIAGPTVLRFDNEKKPEKVPAKKASVA
ncbi:protein translocase subunit SecDF [Chryseolinea sp. T2]|uniref:protein translocase subunit SecDF n=1 Tax=Chryseolinea sp. T2 TaxID=3129255 RepID=UPI0030780BA5